MVNKSIRVLIVDDCKEDLLIFRKLWNRFMVNTNNQNISLDEAHNSSKSLELLKRHSYTLIILDQKLPNNDGISIAKSIRSLESTTDVFSRIIAYSNCNLIDFQHRCIEIGMDGFISKYMELHQLKELLDPHLIRNKVVQ